MSKVNTADIVAARAAALSRDCPGCGAKPWRPCRDANGPWRSHCGFCGELGSYGIHSSRWEAVHPLEKLAWAGKSIANLPRVCYGRDTNHLPDCPKMFGHRAVAAARAEVEKRRTVYQRVLRRGLTTAVVPSEDELSAAVLGGVNAVRDLYASHGIAMDREY